MQVVRAVGTAHTESWFSEVADEGVCKPLYSLNRTLQPIIEAVSRCPNPHKTLRQVNPEHIIWTRVHKKNGREPVDPNDRSPRSPGNHADVPHSSPGADGGGRFRHSPTGIFALMTVYSRVPSSCFAHLTVMQTSPGKGGWREDLWWGSQVILWPSYSCWEETISLINL